MTAPSAPLFVARSRRWHWVALAGIVLVALLLRVHRLDAQSLWLDEIFTIMLAAGHGVGFKDIPVGTLLEHGPDLTGFGDVPFYSIPFRLKGDVHPPLVYLLLHVWIVIGGKGDFWVRLFPTVFSLASVGMLFFAARRTLGVPLALGVAAVSALSAFEIYNAQEVRSYTLLQLLMVGAVWAALRVAERVTTRRLAVWAGLMFGLCMTHYFALGAAVGLGLWLLLAVGGKDRLRVILAGSCAIGLFAVLWGPFLLQQGGGGGLSGDHMAAKEHIEVTDVLARAATFVPRSVLPPLAPTSAPWVAVGVVLLVGVPLLSALLLTARRYVGREGPVVRAVEAAFIPAADATLSYEPLRPPKILRLSAPWPGELLLPRTWLASPILAWWAILVGSLVMQIALDVAKQTITLRFARYSFHVVPAVYVCAAYLGLALVRHRLWRLVPILLVAGVALYSTVQYGYQRKALWRELGTWVDDNASTETDALLVLSERPNDWRPGANFMCLSHYSAKARELPLLLLDASHIPSQADLASLAERRRVLLLTTIAAGGGGAPLVLPGFQAVSGVMWPFPTGDAPRALWVYDRLERVGSSTLPTSR